jgi:IS30 family transposase
MKRTYSHLDLNERRRIARWRHAGLSIDIIAEKLGRHRSTIFREVRATTISTRNGLISAAIIARRRMTWRVSVVPS